MVSVLASSAVNLGG